MIGTPRASRPNPILNSFVNIHNLFSRTSTIAVYITSCSVVHQATSLIDDIGKRTSSTATPLLVKRSHCSLDSSSPSTIPFAFKNCNALGEMFEESSVTVSICFDNDPVLLSAVVMFQF